MGGDASSRKNESELLEIMETTYLTKAWEEWEELFEEAGVWYQKIQSVEQVVEDEQAARAWVPIPPSPLVRNRSPSAGPFAFLRLLLPVPCTTSPPCICSIFCVCVCFCLCLHFSPCICCFCVCVCFCK